MSKRRAMVELDIGADSIEIRLSATAAVFAKRPARLDGVPPLPAAPGVLAGRHPNLLCCSPRRRGLIDSPGVS